MTSILVAAGAAVLLCKFAHTMHASDSLRIQSYAQREMADSLVKLLGAKGTVACCLLLLCLSLLCESRRRIIILPSCVHMDIVIELTSAA